MTRARVTERLAFGGLLVATLAVLLPILMIVGTLVVRGFPALSWEFVASPPRNGMREGGIMPAIVGTAVLVVGTIALALPLGVLGSAEIAEVVERSLRQAALWDEAKDKLGKSALALSGGQQQRLCIARAIAVEPEVLLMDEPASALDPISTAKIEDLIEDLKKTYTIVIVTHNMQQAARISDRTAFFLDGKLVEYGETELVFRAPSDRRTEDYVTGRFG